MLGDISDGAAILAAEAQALDHPKTEQHERGGETDLVESRKQPDRAGTETHAAERDEERVFAADAVAQPSEQECAQWANQESGGEQRDGAQERRNRMALFEELDRQDGSQAAKD